MVPLINKYRCVRIKSLSAVYFCKAICLTCVLAFDLPLRANEIDDLESLKSQVTRLQGVEKAKAAAKIAFQLRQADADQALYYTKMALKELEEQAHLPTKVNVINTIAIAHLQKRDYESTINYSEHAIQLSKEIGLPLEEARALNTLGALNWHQGDLNKAKTLFESALNLRKQNQALSELSPSLNNLGVIEEIQGNYDKAIELYLQAVEFAEQIGDDEQLARPISNLGVLHQMLKNFDKALLFYRRSLELKSKVGNLVGTAIAYNNISEIHIERKEYQAAIQSLESGLGILDTIEAPQEKALLLINSGTAYLHLNNPDKAKIFFDQARQLVSQFKSQETDIYLAQGYARTFLQKNELDTAFSYAQAFLTLAEAKQDRNSIKNAQYLQYQIHKQKGQYVEALAAYENYFQTHETLTRKENTDYVARLQAEFDTEKTEKELAILQKENALHEIDIKRQQFFRNLAIVVCLSILVISFFIYRMRTIRVKATLLEQKVAERTEEIQEKNIAIAELLKQKEKLLNRKNELFSTVSHEFRTPLTLIMGPLKQLANKANKKETQLTLSNVLRNATRLLRMVDQLLDLARIDMQAELASEAVDISVTIRFLTTSMATLFEENGLTCSTEVSTGIWIEISPEALEKIIVNLISNAVKYTPRKGHIYITAAIENTFASISIRDTGIGIAKEQQNRIFERFTRLENSLNMPVPGAGIGLALVKELVEHYNGKITVASEPDEGSTFTICFPHVSTRSNINQKALRSTACQNELAVFAPRDDSSVISEDQGLNEGLNQNINEEISEDASEKNGTVLIVEDNKEMRHFIGGCLNKFYHCLFAEDGKQGVRLAIKEIPDLIISDLMMPHVSGLELAATLKEGQLTSHIPIIILTAKGDPETRQTAWRKNVDEYIEKPFDADELLLRCENIISIRQLLSERFNQKASQKSASSPKQTAKIHVDRSYFSQKDQAFLDKLNHYLEHNFCESHLNAKTISQALAITEKQLQRKVKALTNETIPACVRSFRLKKGADLLATGASVTTVAFDVGFSSQSYFSTAFTARYGCSPKDYQLQKRKEFEKTSTSNN